MGERREGEDWSPAAVRALLAEYGRTPQDLAVSELAGGQENRNLLVEAGGERLVLRRYDATPPEEVPWELALLRFLTGAGFPTAPLVERPDGGLAATFGGRPVALFRFVQGRHPEGNVPSAADQAAAVIARLHAVTDGLQLPYPRSRMDSRQRLARFLTWREEQARAPEPELARFGAQVEAYAATFAGRLAPHERSLPRGVVHHDAHAGNLLFDDAGRLVALLDFDDAHESYLLADVAVLLDVWGTDPETHRFSPERAARTLRSYDRRRPLQPGELELLPDFLALYRLADATSYVASRVQRGVPADRALADCGQYAKFVQATDTPDWQDRLRTALTAEFAAERRRRQCAPRNASPIVGHVLRP